MSIAKQNKSIPNNPVKRALWEWLQSQVGKAHGWKVKAAELVGISSQHLNQYLREDGPLPGNKTWQRLREIGAPVDQIQAATKKTPGAVILHVELIDIPVYEYVRAGGKSLVLAERPARYMSVPKSRDQSRFAVVVRGDSMYPEVKDGDVVIVSEHTTPKAGDLCLVRFDDHDACLRRVYFHDHSITLTSANEKEYPPATYKKSEVAHIYRVMEKITRY